MEPSQRKAFQKMLSVLAREVLELQRGSRGIIRVDKVVRTSRIMVLLNVLQTCHLEDTEEQTIKRLEGMRNLFQKNSVEWEAFQLTILSIAGRDSSADLHSAVPLRALTRILSILPQEVMSLHQDSKKISPSNRVVRTARIFTLLEVLRDCSLEGKEIFVIRRLVLLRELFDKKSSVWEAIQDSILRIVSQYPTQSYFVESSDDNSSADVYYLEDRQPK